MEVTSETTCYPPLLMSDEDIVRTTQRYVESYRNDMTFVTNWRPTPPYWNLEIFQQFGMIVDRAEGIFVLKVAQFQRFIGIKNNKG